MLPWKMSDSSPVVRLSHSGIVPKQLNVSSTIFDIKRSNVNTMWRLYRKLVVILDWKALRDSNLVEITVNVQKQTDKVK